MLCERAPMGQTLMLAMHRFACQLVPQGDGCYMPALNLVEKVNKIIKFYKILIK